VYLFAALVSIFNFVSLYFAAAGVPRRASRSNSPPSEV